MKNLEMTDLFDLYGSLLTEKQSHIMEMYYFDDLSLGEIGEDLGISRQAVHDTIKRCEDAIEEYERKLGLYASRKAYVNELKEIKSMTLDIFNECKAKNYTRSVAEKTIVLLEELDKKLEDYDNSEYTEQD